MNQQRSPSRAMIVIGLLLALGTFARAQDGQNLSDANKPVVQQDRASRPMQDKIDAYIARVAEEETFEKLAAGLNKHEDRLFFAAAHPSEPVVETAFEVCLANRRVARLFEVLQTRDDADVLCRNLFDEKLEILRNHKLTTFERIDRKGGPQLRKPPFTEPIMPIHEDRTALSAALFLSAEFCSVEEVLDQLDRWIDLHRELVEKFDAMSANWDQTDQDQRSRVRRSRKSLDYDVLPEQRYLLNLLASMLHRRFGVDPGGTELDRADMFASVPEERWYDFSRPVPRMMGYYKIPLCAWNARTNPFDSTQVLNGIPVDDSHVLGEFLLFHSFMLMPIWDSHPVMGSKDEDLRARQQRILDRLREALGTAAAAERRRAGFTGRQTTWETLVSCVGRQSRPYRIIKPRIRAVSTAPSRGRSAVLATPETTFVRL